MVTVSGREKIACPACGWRLSGTRFTGFRCAKCHAHFSGRFIMQSQRMHAKQLIDKHFGQPLPETKTVIEKSTIVFEDAQGKLERALAKAAAQMDSAESRRREPELEHALRPSALIHRESLEQQASSAYVELPLRTHLVKKQPAAKKVVTQKTATVLRKKKVAPGKKRPRR